MNIRAQDEVCGSMSFSSRSPSAVFYLCICVCLCACVNSRLTCFSFSSSSLSLSSMQLRACRKTFLWVRSVRILTNTPDKLTLVNSTALATSCTQTRTDMPNKAGSGLVFSLYVHVGLKEHTCQYVHLCVQSYIPARLDFTILD